MKKIIIAAVVVLVLALGGYVVAGPYLTLDNIRTGIVEQNQEQLAAHIDFPVLRENMKEQLTAAMNARLAQKSAESEFGAAAAAMGTLLASKVVGTLVDKVATPAGLAMMTSSKQAQSEGLSKGNVLQDVSVSFEGLDRAIVTQSGNPDVTMVLTRQGLSWRLTNILLPMGEMTE